MTFLALHFIFIIIFHIKVKTACNITNCITLIICFGSQSILIHLIFIWHIKWSSLFLFHSRFAILAYIVNVMLDMCPQIVRNSTHHQEEVSMMDFGIYRRWRRNVSNSPTLLQQSLLYPYSPTVYVAIKHWTCGECN